MRARTQKRKARGEPESYPEHLLELARCFLRAPSVSEEEDVLERALAIAAERHGYDDQGEAVVAFVCDTESVYPEPPRPIRASTRVDTEPNAPRATCIYSDCPHGGAQAETPRSATCAVCRKRWRRR